MDASWELLFGFAQMVLLDIGSLNSVLELFYEILHKKEVIWTKDKVIGHCNRKTDFKKIWPASEWLHSPIQYRENRLTSP